MPKVKVGDVVFYRNWRLGDEVFLAKVNKVCRKKGLVQLVPFSGGYGHGWTWGGKPLPTVLTTSLEIFQEEPVWLAAGEAIQDKQKQLDLLEELLASPEAQEKLSGIGEGCSATYHSTTSVEEAEELISTVMAAQRDPS